MALAGATKVIEGGGLCASRNRCIELAEQAGGICLEMSDDLSMIKILHQEGTWDRPGNLTEANALARATPTYLVSPVTAARYIEVYMRQVGAKLGGVYPTPNEGAFSHPVPMPYCTVMAE